MLARLRAAVEDELFIRSSSAMTPTHACRRLFPRVERILAEMDALTHEPQVFRPSHIKRIFRVMLHEQLFLAHFADVFREVRRLAPGVSIVVEAVSDAGHEALKTGELDAMIFPMTDNVSPDIKAQFLATCDFDILMRTGHPWLTEVNKLPEQHTALWCPYVQAATELLPESDLTMVVYSPLARELCRRGGLTALSLASLDCGYPLGFLRHGRRDDDPALEWLRAVFVSCFNRKH